MIIKKGFMLRNVAGNNIVVAVGEASKHFSGVITLNETGAFLWNLLTVETTKEELLKSLLNEYDISEEVASRDIDAFLKKLKDNKIIE